ncbi:non-specific lipid-transfer protein 2-like [Pyrus x bretschneideri]|uniref:non-specific lipid-transfer protein 2-like n=1 Tax=Pyrus x bretschneideri TaxID=225117 RepID=UPI00202F7012|nr:non-specific lipid-transfer protein 2-like [Pyrus x bretschneideri]
MKLSSRSLVLCLVVAVAVVLCEVAGTTEAVTCSPVELSPCMGPIRSGSAPSGTCCQKLREQRPCLCGYIKNPALRTYVTSPNARKLASACGVPIPQC